MVFLNILCLLLVHLLSLSLTSSIKWSFFFNAEKWYISGNKRIIELPGHHPFSLSSGSSRYIIGHDTLINTDYKNPDDKNLWYFESPSFTATLTNKSIIKFSLLWFSGNTEKEHLNENALDQCVRLCEINEQICIRSSCFTTGFSFNNNIVVPFAAKRWSGNFLDFSKKFFGNPTEYRLSILGDWTRRNETFGIDDVELIE